MKLNLTYNTNISDVYKLEDNMSLSNIYETYQSLKTSVQKIEFCEMMKTCFPAMYNINWDSIINLINNSEDNSSLLTA